MVAPRAGTQLEHRTEHRRQQSLGREQQQDQDEHEDGELHHLPHEADVAPVALDEIEQQRPADRRQGQEQQESDDDHESGSGYESGQAADRAIDRGGIRNPTPIQAGAAAAATP